MPTVQTPQTSSKQNGSSHEFAKAMSSAAGSQDGHIEDISFGLGERVAHMATDIAGATSQYVKSGREYVRENPGKGVAYAAAAGMAAGCLITLALSRRH